MGFWIVAALWVGSLILGRVLQPRAPKFAAVNAEPEKFSGITAEEGRPIPVLWGTRQFKGLNIGWFGDLSQTAVVQSGVTTGYRYFMGAQFLVCQGPIDELISIDFNDRPVGLTIDDSNDQLVVAIGADPNVTAYLEHKNYANGDQLARAASDAIKAAKPGDWKATFGFYVRAGYDDEVTYTTYSGKQVVRIPAGRYLSGGSLAAALTTQLNLHESANGSNGLFTCGYDGGTGKFSITFQPFSSSASWKLHGGADVDLDACALSLLGFKLDETKTITISGFSGTATGDFQVLLDRFVFAYAGTDGALLLTDAGFTAASVFGLSTAADATIGSRLADSDFTGLSAAYTYMTDYIQVDITDPNFFGADQGGVSGRLDIYLGSDSQAASDYLTTQFGTTAPGYRGVCQAIMRHMEIGNSNTPKPLSLTLRRCPNQLGLSGEQQNIMGDANPACMLWELLTDQIWGLGMPEAQLEKQTFIDAGETLAAEMLGMSMILDATAPASDIALEILRHIDGVLYVDHLSGLLALRLARADYVVANLPTIDPTNAISCELSQRSWDETRNVVRVRYVDRASAFVERVVQVQDQANIDSRGGDMAIEDIPMPGLSNEAAATVVANRSLKVLSAMPRQAKIIANRQSWALRPGAPFKLNWSHYGISDMPCRVSTIGTGSLPEGQIRIEAIQDVIGPAWIGFATPTAPAEDPPE